MRALLFACAVLAGCSHTSSSSDRRSWQQLIDSAGRHDQAAAEHEAQARVLEGLPANLVCTTDPVLDENLTSGIEPIAFNWVPCSDVTRDAGHSRRFLAREERRKATAERKRALELRSAELERSAARSGGG
ncbi:MAG TPA: hypothetical protein VM513_01025 [Kofleriaceae bacterium]|nr:hypothetical protein [Kofleriaceae bacterium]